MYSLGESKTWSPTNRLKYNTIFQLYLYCKEQKVIRGALCSNLDLYPRSFQPPGADAAEDTLLQRIQGVLNS